MCGDTSDCVWTMDALIVVTHLIAQLNGLTSHPMVTLYEDRHPVNKNNIISEYLHRPLKPTASPSGIAVKH